MKRIFKKILFIGLIIFLLMQLYQPARNLGYGQDITANFTKVYNVPKNVKTILRTSCYDCHSNYTNYPWYSNIQPARFFMESHIKEGKEELNFSEYGNYSQRKQNSKLKAISKQIKLNEMPLASYTLIHKNAILSSSQKQEVMDWIEKTSDSLSSKY
jgi:hypothetical protein